MTTKKRNAKKPKATLVDATIRGIESEYTAGSWASVRATLCYATGGGRRVDGSDERVVMAIAHRLAADLLTETPADAHWCLPRVELVSSYQDKVIARIDVELATGSEAERDRALGLFHDVIPPPEG